MIFQMEPNSSLDIGSRTVKGITLKKVGDKMHVQDWFLVDMLKGRGLLPKSEEISSLVKAALEANRWNNRWVGALFDDKEVVCFEFSLPKIPENEIRAAVENEMEQKLNYPVSEAIIEFSVIPVSEQNLLVRIYCVKKSLIEEKISTLKSYKLLPDVLVSEAMANLECMKFNGYLDNPGYNILIDLGESHTTTSLILDAELVQSNSLWTGSGLVNQKLVQTCSISYEDADALKINHNFDDEKPTEFSRSIDDAYSEILIGVHKSIDYYKIKSKGSNIQNIFLSGGGSTQSGLASVIEDNFKIQTQVVNPFKNIEIFSAKHDQSNIGELSSYFGAAIGLALRGAA